MDIVLHAAACSDKGCVRQNNEDSFSLNGFSLQKDQMDQGGLFRCAGEPSMLFAVCDGMGGEEAGEEASFLSVELCRGFLSTPDKWASKSELEAFLYSGCKAVYDQARSRGNRSGATIALVLMDRNGVRAVNMGDSRIYRLRGESLEQLSYDHTEVHRLLLQGKITKDQIKTHPKRHMINQYWGMPLDRAPFTPFIGEVMPYEVGDRYLLCSDGLTDMLEDEQIEAILAGNRPIERIAEELVHQAKLHGGRDNVTVVTVEVAQKKDEQSEQEARREQAAASRMKRLRARRRRLQVMLGVFLAAEAYLIFEWIDLLFLHGLLI
ncbi:MAG: PP2C family protein-serine/threonine phosphatase [Candidatus Ventricola sp.]